LVEVAAAGFSAAGVAFWVLAGLAALGSLTGLAAFSALAGLAVAATALSELSHLQLGDVVPSLQDSKPDDLSQPAMPPCEEQQPLPAKELVTGKKSSKTEKIAENKTFNLNRIPKTSIFLVVRAINIAFFPIIGKISAVKLFYF
jgi:hypothetical protein